MVVKLLKSLFGSRNERVLKRLVKAVKQINELEPSYQQLSDADLAAKTDLFRQRLQAGETLDSVLPEAFAAVREAAQRTLKFRHFDVQMIGGMVLHEGNIAEMLTGEGKTLASTLPLYLNALEGKGVHLITVNDYLAKRDAEWMAPVYNFLGLTVGVNLTGMSHEEKQAAYRADITYGTNNEFGFDYLRDNMAFELSQRVQRGLNFAVVDEVDSILIDEARTPLIISGPTEDSAEMYRQINQLIPRLIKQEQENGPGDYSLDEKSRQAYLTEQGHQTVEQELSTMGLLGKGESLYDSANIQLMHHISAGLRAHALFHKDVDYIAKNDQIVIVDEHTGRLMQGRRWSDGLHQAVEAKENVTIQNENQTLASITFQNYFRLYDTLSGMTGTADTEAYEFQQIYGLEVVAIPPNRVVKRTDNSDKVYLSVDEKFKAIIAEINDCQQRGQPVLVGTASIETSERLAALLKQEKIKHEVLNAKQHEREAHIIAQAGQPGAVTIATNMAGRGTDIVLGGNLASELALLVNPAPEEIEARTKAWELRHQQVVAAGGLHVLGSERHESRRIDNQLRGRSGRQGDPGSSRFYLSLQDNLLRIFASDKLSGLMQRLGVPDGEALESSLLSRVIENAQRKVESYNFDVRKQLLEFDNVANEQRKVIYSQRTDIMAADDVSETIQAMLESAVTQLINQHIPPDSFEEQWDIPALNTALREEFGIAIDVAEWFANDENLQPQVLPERILEQLKTVYKHKENTVGREAMRQLEKSVLLQSLDMFWKEHLAAIDYLRQGIHLRGYAQKNPKQEYKRESFELFSSMLENLQRDVAATLCRIQVQQPAEVMSFAERRREIPEQEMIFVHEQKPSVLTEHVATAEEAPSRVLPFVRGAPKVGRNDQCPCGSGKKYKQCHGQLQ